MKELNDMRQGASDMLVSLGHDPLPEPDRTEIPEGEHGEWISVKDRLPKAWQMVALMDVNIRMNVSEEVNNQHLLQCGFIHTGFGKDYWSVSYERARPIDAYTHWTPLPPKDES